jgi:hypothetical protein
VGAYGGESAIQPVASGPWPRRRGSGRPGSIEAFPGEVETVERARTDAAAFGRLYEHHAPLIYRFINNRLRDPA